VTSLHVKLNQLSLTTMAPACARRTASPVLAAPKPAKVVPLYSGANRQVLKVTLQGMGFDALQSSRERPRHGQ